jgi:hypothetical protein
MDQVFRKIAIRPPTLRAQQMIEWQAMSVHGGQLEHCSRWYRKISFCRAIEYPSQKFHAQRPSGR